MKVKIFLNTDGFLGGWGTTRAQTGDNIFEIPDKEIEIFHKSIDCRDRIEILPLCEKKFDAQFGDLKIRFNDFSRDSDIKKTREAHKFNKKQNKIEQAIFQK